MREKKKQKPVYNYLFPPFVLATWQKPHAKHANFDVLVCRVIIIEITTTGLRMLNSIAWIENMISGCSKFGRISHSKYALVFQVISPTFDVCKICSFVCSSRNGQILDGMKRSPFAIIIFPLCRFSVVIVSSICNCETTLCFMGFGPFSSRTALVLSGKISDKLLYPWLNTTNCDRFAKYGMKWWWRSVDLDPIGSNETNEEKYT